MGQHLIGRGISGRLLAFIQIEEFVRSWESLGLVDDDLRALETQIMERPTGAPVVPGTGGLRKARFAPPSWSVGKRGATRVGYSYFELEGTVFLLTVYSKGEKADLTPAERKAIRGLLERLRSAIRRKRP